MILKKLCNKTVTKQNKLNNITRENIYGLKKKRKKSDKSKIVEYLFFLTILICEKVET